MTEELEEKVVMYDVDGTITEEGDDNPKSLAVEELMELAESGLEAQVNFESLDEKEVEELKEAFKEAMEKAVTNPKYYKRYVQSEEEAREADRYTKNMIIFEVLKDKSPKLAKTLIPIMAYGIISGKFPIRTYKDAVQSIKEQQDKYLIATFSGGSKGLQKIMLDNADPEISSIIQRGAGFHDKDDFGKKTNAESYSKAEKHFASQGQQLYAWITDSAEEAIQCKLGAPDVISVFVDKVGVKDKYAGIQKQGVQIVNDIREAEI